MLIPLFLHTYHISHLLILYTQQHTSLLTHTHQTPSLYLVRTYVYTERRAKVLEAEGDKTSAELESQGTKIRMKNESEGMLIKISNEAEARKIQLILEVI